ncbi:Predicted dithiol-disulfide isomerase, DsbA family [Desulfosporosinus hippei DSM 8344]|uniref:Predicted dithiol-disulfide isomerase, DsbA family n=2 Tax=Desulfosporosinus TaxID=79206 RepID=A0A1G8JZJ5_9FIRM|nr:Predicted dithiol-disulfide isomerase, DsbA family [Desulfosporosinus hippei DSM 8344]
MIGKIPLDQLARDKNLIVEWKAFELRPEGVELPEKSPADIANAKARLEALGQKYGIYMTFNEKNKHSRLALEGSKYAEEHGLGNEYHDATFAAQFQESKDINDLSVLYGIAAQIGLDQEEFRDALVTKKYEQAVLQDLAEAKGLGIQSVPCFIIDNRALHGAQNYNSLEKFLKGTRSGFPLDINVIK